MRSITRLLVLFLLVATVTTSCKKDPEAPNIEVAFKVDPATPVAGQEVTFTQAATGGSDFVWTIEGEEKTGATVTHIFDVEGTYEVSLQVDGWDELTYSKPVNVGAQVPNFTKSSDVIEMYNPVTFTADIFNPENANVEFKWIFSAADVVSDVTEGNVEFMGKEILDIVFSHDGAITFTIEATINGKMFSGQFQINVVKQLAKTLFWAEKGGNLWNSKLYTSGIPEAIDMDIESGAHPLTIQVANDRIYVLDAGSTIGYSADMQTEIGSIVSYALDGTAYKAHIPSFGGHNYGDAFFGYVDAEYIYFTDRNNDVTRIPVDSENVEWVTDSGTANPENVPAFVANNQLKYYSAYSTGASYGWGALNGSFYKRGEVFWWAKNSNHKGLWRFKEGDINKVAAEDAMPADGGILTDFTVRAFVIDEDNSTIYFSVNRIGSDGIGFYKSDLEGNNVTLIDASPVDGEGGGNEYTYITGIVVDNESGYVYWAYRGPATVDGEPVDYEANPLYKSGIKKYKLDGTGEVEYFVEGVEAYGLTINHTKQ